MRLTIIPYNCKRGCDFCYLKTHEEINSDFMTSLIKLIQSNIFTSYSLFFNSDPSNDNIDLINNIINLVKINDIYIDWRDYIENAQYIDAIKTPLAISKYPGNSVGLRILKQRG